MSSAPEPGTFAFGFAVLGFVGFAARRTGTASVDFSAGKKRWLQAIAMDMLHAPSFRIPAEIM